MMSSKYLVLSKTQNPGNVRHFGKRLIVHQIVANSFPVHALMMNCFSPNFNSMLLRFILTTVKDKHGHTNVEDPSLDWDTDPS